MNTKGNGSLPKSGYKRINMSRGSYLIAGKTGIQRFIMQSVYIYFFLVIYFPKMKR